MFRSTLAAAVLAATSLVSAPVSAANIDLAFIMDSSGSVGSSNFGNAMKSLGDALAASIPVGGADTYRIGVITFSSSAKVTTFKTISTQADLDAAVSDIKSEGFMGSVTNYKAAFDLARNTFGALGDSSIVNMMTDGDPCCSSSSKPNAISARNNLKAAGWDSLSFEAISLNSSSTNFLKGLGFDTQGDGARELTAANQITDPLNDAFVLKVSGFGAAYDSAIKAKVRKIVVPGVPVPASLPLLLTAFGLAGVVARRRKAA